LVTHKTTLFKRITVCSLIVLALIAIVPGQTKAGNAAYSMTEYQCIALATIDGMWTTADEWNDGPQITMSNNASFTYNFDVASYSMQWLVEFFTDNTNDTGDFWQICLDSDNSGGAAPQIGDFKIEIQGHTTLIMYQGNGIGWTEISPQASELTWVNTVSASTWNSAPHWILELSDSSKVAGTLQTPQPPNGMRVAVYDAATGEFASWAPNSSANVPNQWGVISSYSTAPIADPNITPTPTPTSAPTSTAAPTPTPRATVTPTQSAAPTATPTQTATPSPTPKLPAEEELTPETQVKSIEPLQDTVFILLIICVETLIFATSKNLKKK
jgi:hypothetical protein